MLLMPAQRVEQSTAGFLSDVALKLMATKGLEEPGRQTLDLMQSLAARRLRISVSKAQDKAFHLTADQGLVLSLQSAENILHAQNRDPAELLHTGANANVDASLLGEWLELLAPSPTTQAWENAETLARWQHALNGGAEPFKTDEKRLAAHLWQTIKQAHNAGDQADIAARFGHARLDKLEESTKTLLTQVGYARDLLSVFMQQGEYRQALDELGLRAANLVKARELATAGTLGPLTARRLLTALEASYDEIYHLLSRTFEPGLLIRPY